MESPRIVRHHLSHPLVVVEVCGVLLVPHLSHRFHHLEVEGGGVCDDVHDGQNHDVQKAPPKFQ